MKSLQTILLVVVAVVGYRYYQKNYADKAKAPVIKKSAPSAAKPAPETTPTAPVETEVAKPTATVKKKLSKHASCKEILSNTDSNLKLNDLLKRYEVVLKKFEVIRDTQTNRIAAAEARVEKLLERRAKLDMKRQAHEADLRKRFLEAKKVFAGLKKK